MTNSKFLFHPTCLKLLFAGLALLPIPSLLAAQSQVADLSPGPQFDVVVIKPTPPETKNWKREFNPGLMNIQNLTVFQMVKYAYDLNSDAQLLDLPGWATTEHFDIQGKEDEELIKRLRDSPNEQYSALNRQLVRGMLKERFHLEAHYSLKERPIYSLTVAKNGARVKPFDASDGKTFRGLLGPNGNVQARGASMQFLADRISALPEAGDRVVVDNTGMAGEYGWSLRWTPEGSLGSTSSGEPSPTAIDAPPGLFTALEEQLGLKLVPQKGAVNVLVVDRVKRPTSN